MEREVGLGVSPAFEGKRIRKESMHLEFGGPNVDGKFELVRAASLEEVRDGHVEVVGPEIRELKEGGSYPLGILALIAGAKVDRDLEGVVERRIHTYTNYIEDVMHMNQRDSIWIRIGKKAASKGFNFKFWGETLIKLCKSELPFIEKMQVTFITDPKVVSEKLAEALEAYRERDEKVRNLREEDVELFYGCVLCQSFAPSHVCVITPERPSLCGALTWFDARAAANIDPKGPNFPIPKGELLNREKGEWSGANEAVSSRSLGAVSRVYLHSALECPHTSCGCFECIVFYIPEVDGFGIVDRGFKDPAVNGLPFSSMAPQASGGMQTPGFVGIGVSYMKSRKFLQGDGGWPRVAWMTSALKEVVKSAMPHDLVDKIATERDAKTVDELKSFLVEKGHPLAMKLRKAQVAPQPEQQARCAAEPLAVPLKPSSLKMPTSGVGVRITLHGARVRVGKLTVRRGG